MSKLAADASSFYNVDLETSLEKIRAGLTGESEPLKAFGVFLDEASVKTEAMRLGLVKNAKDLSNRTKIVARASLIEKGLATASGDLERTQSSASNQLRKAGGGLENFATAIGQLLIPSIQSGVGVFNELLFSIVETFEANQPLIQSWADSLTSAIGTVGLVVRNFGAFWQIASLKAQEAIANVLAYVDVIAPNLAIVGEYLANNWTKLIADGVNAVGRLFQNLGTNLGELRIRSTRSSRTRQAASNSTGRRSSRASRRRPTLSPS